MSRGIFRRYLQYITQTLQHWQDKPAPHNPITPETVKTTITTERLAEDMELELSELFPKQSELRLKAVQLLLHLQESGLKKQTQLTKDLDLEPYKLSRLLEKLELNKYVKRKRDGIDKIVNLTETE
jgi:DNA-binding MarR family transcriptional regulator